MDWICSWMEHWEQAACKSKCAMKIEWGKEVSANGKKGAASACRVPWKLSPRGEMLLFQSWIIVAVVYVLKSLCECMYPHGNSKALTRGIPFDKVHFCCLHAPLIAVNIILFLFISLVYKLSFIFGWVSDIYFDFWGLDCCRFVSHK